MASDSRQALARILFEAIRAEGDGQRFYQMAARSTEDVKAREVFARLAEEERGHQEFLKAQYRSILDTGGPDPAVRLGRPADLSDASPIFSPALRDRIAEAHIEMSALSIGIQLELSSINHYRGAAEQADDEMIRGFFTELVEWESGHYHALLRQQESLKEAYWSAAGFAPF